MEKTGEEQIQDLYLEDIFSVIFIVLGILGIYADEVERRSIREKDKNKHNQATKIFDFILLATIILYIIFLYRNYQSYQESPIEKRNLFLVKILASCFFLAGIICTIYFQREQEKSENR